MALFEGKTVFVSGATRGIGASIAAIFIENGATVYGSATQTSTIENRRLAGVFPADFANREDIEKCAEYIRTINPDILVNNAGINNPSSFEQIDHDEFLKIQQVNVFAPMALCQAAIPSMVNSGWGRIVNISSAWSKKGKEQRAPYSSSKFAIDGLTLSLAIEYAKSGILANCVAPGFVDTEMTRRILGDIGIEKILQNVPIGRLAQPEEIAQVVLWLASPQNTYITGQNIFVDGGFTRA
ncbi:MAG: SDR family oxidoreductase [Actinobacteria bacterium]|jgi:3-oxoacyl-[acyl-carrier protein] reductase|nr:SDR family oxidoreductase [Actinomycetota bacterium]